MTDKELIELLELSKATKKQAIKEAIFGGLGGLFLVMVSGYAWGEQDKVFSVVFGGLAFLMLCLTTALLWVRFKLESLIREMQGEVERKGHS